MSVSLRAIANRAKIRIYSRMPRAVSSRLIRLVKRTHLIGVVAVVFNDRDEVLILRHTYHSPVWRLPGGIFERLETVAETARRETMEEASCDIDVYGVIDVESNPYSFDVAVLARLVMEHPFQPNAEVVERKWVNTQSIGELPREQRRFVFLGRNRFRSI